MRLKGANAPWVERQVQAVFTSASSEDWCHCPKDARVQLLESAQKEMDARGGTADLEVHSNFTTGCAASLADYCLQGAQSTQDFLPRTALLQRAEQVGGKRKTWD